MTARNYVAIDLGAESGRVVVGCLDAEQLTLSEVHRFTNGPVQVGAHLHWDVLRIFNEVLAGLSLAAERFGTLTSAGVDTWGVDFGLLDRNGELIGNPYHYRDPHTEGVMERVFEQVSRETVFGLTGVQPVRFNTLFQLYALKIADSPALGVASRLLMMPDLFHYWLTGEQVSEHTIASTTQAYSAGARAWVADLLHTLGLPTTMLPEIVGAGSTIGPLRSKVAAAAGLNQTLVVAPACHDTASAVAAVPASHESHAFLSSGTWSLMGVVVPKPLINDQTRHMGLTNEGGVADTVRLLKNINGLWLVQQCRKSWAGQGELVDYASLTEWAERAGQFGSVVDPDHPALLSPTDMPRALQQLCAETAQWVPQTKGEILRVALESLACKYRLTLEQLEQVTGQHLEVIHVVGGGSQNRLLCQLTADACERVVLAGPTETTALGNVLAQALASGGCRGWTEARELVRRAFPLRRYDPQSSDFWQDSYARFLEAAHPGQAS